jgi:lysozyme
MKASAKLRMAIREEETFSAKVYDDGNGVATQGWGHTGPDVAFGNPDCDLKKAQLWFDGDISKAEREVDRLVKVTITQGMYDALVSFEFNCGGLEFLVDKKPRPSRALVAINERRWNDVAEELIKWNMDGGKDRRGLLSRRAREILFYTSERYPT